MVVSYLKFILGVYMPKINVVKPIIGEEEEKLVTEVLQSGILAEGQKTRQFEQQFAQFVGAKHAIMVNNGTAALHLALEALDIPPGSEIITPGFTFIASANSTTFIGGVPIFGEIHPRSFNLDPSQVESLITEKTKAIMPVHIFGLPADMPAFEEIAHNHDLLLIEDAAQGHGGKINGQHVSTFGDVGCFSFYATKNMICGEGGMVVTNSDEIADRARSIKNHGRAADMAGGYAHFRVGYNLRAPDFSAAIGIAQLEKLPRMLENRARTARIYREELQDLPLFFQEVPDGFTHGNYITAPYLTTDQITPVEVVQKLREKDVGARPIYDVPVYKQPVYLKIQNWRWAQAGVQYPDYSMVSLPITEKIASKHFEIPSHAGVTEDEAFVVVDSLKEILRDL